METLFAYLGRQFRIVAQPTDTTAGGTVFRGLRLLPQSGNAVQLYVGRPAAPGNGSTGNRRTRGTAGPRVTSS